MDCSRKNPYYLFPDIPLRLSGDITSSLDSKKVLLDLFSEQPNLTV